MATRKNEAHDSTRMLAIEGLESRINLTSFLPVGPLSDLPLLSSNPTSAHKIFLDFDGHVVAGTSWNNGFRDSQGQPQPIHARAFDRDNDPTTFSEDEIDFIESIWEQVAEDFSMFDVDVTTIEPSLQQLEAGSTALRVLFSDEYDSANLGGTGLKWYNGAGNLGVATFSAWAAASDTPVWVFSSSLWAGGTATHEIGHAFGLRHDAYFDAGPPSVFEAYYSGHTIEGSTQRWGTHMGGGSTTSASVQNISQWDQGEYPGATNSNQDDVAVLAAALGFRGDDHGDLPNASSATVLSSSGGSHDVAGVIEQRSDKDSYMISLGADQLLVAEAIPDTSPMGIGVSINLKLSLIDSTGATVAESTPSGSYAAYISTYLPAGDYYLIVDGVGAGTNSANGFSDYGSLGSYRVRANVTDQSVVRRSRIDYGQSSDAEAIPDARLDLVDAIEIEISADVGASLEVSDLTITGPDGINVDLSSASITQKALHPVDASTNWYVVDISGITLSPGNYEFRIAGGGVVDLLGNLLDGDNDGNAGGDYLVDFLVATPGDANLDGFVDAADVEVIDRYLGLVADIEYQSWSRGNFNGDASIDHADRIILGNYLPLLDSNFSGDFTGDGSVSGDDIDYLYRGVNAEVDAYNTLHLLLPLYDLNQDGALDQLDVDFFVYTIVGTVYGDADLDGDVDLVDLNRLGTGYGNENPGWAYGDFDGDSDVDDVDLSTLGSSFGFGT